LLKGRPDQALLDQLVFSMKRETVKWTNKFIELGGVHLLVNSVIKKNLYVAELGTKEKGLVSQAVLCLKGLIGSAVRSLMPRLCLPLRSPDICCAFCICC